MFNEQLNCSVWEILLFTFSSGCFKLLNSMTRVLIVKRLSGNWSIHVFNKNPRHIAHIKGYLAFFKYRERDVAPW